MFGRRCSYRNFTPAVLLAFGLAVASSVLAQTGAQTAARPALEDGIVNVKSAYPMEETIARLQQDIASKGITFFMAIDQSRLAADAGIKLHPSTLLIFGNPALGTLFITSKAEAGLDWPVRLLVHEDESGTVWATYTDFDWIARRHGIKDRDEQFQKASMVIASITSSVKGR